jgi:hypothetical protein
VEDTMTNGLKLPWKTGRRKDISDCGLQIADCGMKAFNRKGRKVGAKSAKKKEELTQSCTEVS